MKSIHDNNHSRDIQKDQFSKKRKTEIYQLYKFKRNEPTQRSSWEKN